jgi:hypothetical protein
MDYEALKDQWSDVEDRDGIRLSWNTFPSSRMVRSDANRVSQVVEGGRLTCCAGSLPPGGPYRGHVHSAQGETGHAAVAM